MEEGFRTGSHLLSYSKLIDTAEKKLAVMRKFDRKVITQIELEKLLRALEPSRRGKERIQN